MFRPGNHEENEKACVKVDYNMGDIMYGISNCNVVLRIENAYVSFSTADQAEKYYGIEKNKIDEIYGEDSIEVLYLEDRQMNSKIIYKRRRRVEIYITF